MDRAPPQSLQDARRTFIGSAVEKIFYAQGSREPHAFQGTVCAVRDRYLLKQKIIHVKPGAYLYDIKYEDGDIETLGWQDLVGILVSPGAAGKHSAQQLSTQVSTQMSTRMSTQGGVSGSSGDIANNTNHAHDVVVGPDTPAVISKPSLNRRASKEPDAHAGDDEGPSSAEAGPRAQPRQPTQSKRSRPNGSRSQVLGENNTNIQGARACAAAVSPVASGGHEASAAMVVDNNEEAPVHEEFRTEGLPGHVQRVVLQNFMCHENLEVELGPHVNLISGDNGSGKSAILQALQTCLGVSARKTGRGKQLASFIRNGHDQATIMVTLWNKPQHNGEAFKHEQYGDRIVIERTIRRNGGGGYRVFGVDGRSGRSHSTRKEDVDAVLEAFSIDAANPLAVITQDMARAFHAGSKEDKRYKFEKYMSGTALDETQRCIAAAEDHMGQAMAGIEEGEKACKLEEAELERLKKELAKLEGMKRRKEILGHLQNLWAWTMVTDTEAEIEHLTQTIAALEDELLELEQILQDDEQELANIKEEGKRKAATLDMAMKENEQAGAMTTQLRSALRGANTRVKNAEKNKNGLLQQMKELQDQNEDIETQLHGAETQLTQADSGRMAETKRKLEEAFAQIQAHHREMQQLHKEFDELRAQLPDLHQRINDLATKKAEEAHRLRHMLQPQVASVEQRLQSLEGGQANRASSFGHRELPRLQQMISQHRGFQNPPIGPIGAYLTITDARWGHAAEGCLAGVMNRFICFSQQDLQTVNEMARKLKIGNVDAFVVTPNLPRHNVNVNPPQGRNTLLDVIRIDHPDQAACNAIFNVLVDKARIESTILAPDDESAKDVAYNFHGFAAVDARGWRYWSAGQPGQHTNSQTPYTRGNPRLGTDVTHMRQQAQEQLQQARQDILDSQALLTGMEEEDSHLKREQSNINAECDRKQAKKRQMKSTASELERRRDELNAEIMGQDTDQGQQRIIIATQQIQDCDLDIQKLEGELAAAEQELEQAHTARAAADKAFNDHKARLAVGTNFAPINDEIVKLAKQEEAANKRIATSRAKLAETQQRIQDLQADLHKETDRLPGRRETAAGTCPEEVGEAAVGPLREWFTEQFARQSARGRSRRGQATQASEGSSDAEDEAQQLKAYVDAALQHMALRAEFKRLAEEVDLAERSAGGDAAQLEFEVEKQNEKVNKLRARQDKYAENIERICRGLYKRINKHQKMKTLTHDQCNRIFNKHMKRRQSLGEMAVTYEEGTLSVRVKINGMAAPKTKWVEDIKQLSGGERSYTTVCLLLALAEYCEFPFHCLDEYDVFMDAVVRRQTTGMLLGFGADKPDRQLILLTPKDLGVVNDALGHVERKREEEGKPPLPKQFIHTIKMKPPRNAQPQPQQE